mgnify:FL=1
MVLVTVVGLKLALVALVAVAWANSRRGRAALARRSAVEGVAPAPSPLRGYAKAAGAVVLAEAALFLLVALP